MISAKMLNEEATLNQHNFLSAINFVTGTAITLKMMLFDDDLNLRYIPPSTAIVSFIFNLSDGSTLTKIGVPDTDDRSMQTVSITAANSATLIGGNIKISVDTLGNGTIIKKGVAINALTRVLDE